MTRPGRLDRAIYVGLPNGEERHEMFELLAKSMPIPTDEVSLNSLVALTDNFSFAEIRLASREAALCALRENLSSSQITLSHFSAALAKTKPRLIPQYLQDIYRRFAGQVEVGTM